MKKSNTIWIADPLNSRNIEVTDRELEESGFLSIDKLKQVFTDNGYITGDRWVLLGEDLEIRLRNLSREHFNSSNEKLRLIISRKDVDNYFTHNEKNIDNMFFITTYNIDEHNSLFFVVKPRKRWSHELKEGSTTRLLNASKEEIHELYRKLNNNIKNYTFWPYDLNKKNPWSEDCMVFLDTNIGFFNKFKRVQNYFNSERGAKVNLKKNTLNSKRGKDYSLNRVTERFSKINKKNISEEKIGLIGEWLFSFWCNKNNNLRWLEDVEWVSCDDKYSDYDFWAFDKITKQEIKFEVKTTKTNNSHFFISKNELKLAERTKDNWFLVRINLEVFEKSTDFWSTFVGDKENENILRNLIELDEKKKLNLVKIVNYSDFKNLKKEIVNWKVIFN